MTPCKVQNHYCGSARTTGRARKSKDLWLAWLLLFLSRSHLVARCWGPASPCQPLLAPCMHSTRCASHHDTQWTCSQPLTWQTHLRCHDQRGKTLQFQATAPTSCLLLNISSGTRSEQLLRISPSPYPAPPACSSCLSHASFTGASIRNSPAPRHLAYKGSLCD
jgi:hypothetical protein